jgi:hypothetical protein
VIFGPKLSRAERNKIDPTLQLWLDGKGKPEDLGFAPPQAGAAKGVRVSVEFSRAPAAKDIKRYATLGIDAEPNETVAFGAVTRDALVTLARDAVVLYIQPVLLKSPSSKVSR